MPDYYSIHEFSKKLNITPQTLRNWDRSGKLKPHHTGPNGYRYYSKEQVNQVLNIKRNVDPVSIGYCRVSSRKQKDDLERQVRNMEKYLTAQGRPYEVISDIGSGMNYNRKGLHELLEKTVNGQASKIVVLYKDRLARFGFELIEYIASLYGCPIEVVDRSEKTEQQELTEDLIQIMTVFSCKLQGRKQKRTKELLKDLTKEGGDDVQDVQSEASP